MGRLEPQRKAPLLRVLGSAGTVGALYDVLETRREKALDVRGKALDCGTRYRRSVRLASGKCVLRNVLPGENHR
jgi:hypothetical protein